MKRNSRIVMAGFGIAALFFAGMVYAWSVLSGPLSVDYPQWTKAELSLTFTLVMAFFSIGCMAAGFLLKKLGAGKILAVSGALFAAGLTGASRMDSLGMLYLFFGVIAGFASGFAYNAVMGTVGKWFPDKQGMISGVLLMGFGISSFVIGKVYQAYTPEVTGGWRHSFLVLGIAACAVLLICAFFIRQPGPDDVLPKANAGKKKAVNPAARELTAGAMLKTPQFWLYYLWAILLSAAGLALVSQAGGIAKEVGTDVSGSTIATVVGLISVFNGIGRVIFGVMYDRFGRSAVMQADNLLFIMTGAVLAAALKTGSFPGIVAGFVLGGLSYGGVTPTNSAFISSYFGMKNYPQNFSMINTNLIIASFGSTVAGALYDASRSYMSTYIMIAVLAAVGIGISLLIGLCDRKLVK